jgi:TetR/AcrR family transcriptional regulator
MVALKTFQNLTQDKKEAVVRESLREFALHGYEIASLSNVIARLGLAKGSFYRYFESKKTLYLFLLERCTTLRLQFDSDHVGSSVCDLPALLMEHFAAKIKFDKEFPLHSAFLYTVLLEKNNDELKDIHLENKEKILQVTRQVITGLAGKNAVRGSIDANVLSFMIAEMQVMILNYVQLKYHIDFRENIRAGNPLYSLPDTEMLSIAKKFIDIIYNGIALK